MADNKIANAIKFLKGEEKSLPATKTEGQVYFAYKNVGTAEKPSYTGAIYIDTPIGGTQNRIKMTANADIAEYAKKANADSQGNLITGYLRNASLTGNADSQTFTFTAPSGAKFDLRLNGVNDSQAGLITSGDQIFPGYKTLKLRAKPSSIIGSDTENSNGWYKVATSTMSGWGNTNVLYYVKNGYSSKAVGILDFEMRSNNDSIQCWACKWLVRGTGFTPDMFRVVINEMTWTLYVYQPTTQYGRISITEISNIDINGSNPSYKITYYNSTTKETTEPDKKISSSDGGQVYLASKTTSDGNGQNIANTYIKSLSYSNDGKQLIATRGSGDTSLKLSLPIASTTKSGIVTTDAQSFGGTKTFTTINSTNLTITGTSGFNYSGIETATESKARPIWFADSSVNGKPVINTNFTYNPATQTLKVLNLSGTAEKATKDSAGNDIRNTYVSNITISGRTITVTKGSGAKVTLTTQDTDTWRGIQNNLTSDSTTDSLSAAQGKYLKSLIDGKSNNGHNHDDRYYTETEINNKLANYLPLNGGTLTGALNFANGIWNVVGDDVAIGDMNIAGTLGVMGKNGNTAIKLVQFGASTTGGDAAPGVAWTCTGNGTSTISGILSGTFSGSLSGNASTATKLQTARTITLAGSVTGFAAFDGSNNITITTSTNHSHSQYLPLAGGTMNGTSFITWADSGNWNNNNNNVTFPVNRGGLQWNGQSDYVKFFAQETGTDNLELVLQFGDDNSNGLSIRNYAGNETARITASGGFTGTFYGNASTATTAAKLGRDGNTGVPMTFNWSGKNGQPSWLWGSNDGSNMYVYNPSNFNVNYANSAGTSSSCSGNASTASKLATARNIALGGLSSGSANFDGSGNVTINDWGYGVTKYVTRDSTSAPYYRIAYCEVKGSYIDKSVIFTIDSGYNGGGFGIVKVCLRANNTTTAGQTSCEVTWLVRQGFSADQLLTKVNSPAGTSTVQYADLYFKATGTYNGITVKSLSSTSQRDTVERAWTFTNPGSESCRAQPNIRAYTATYTGCDAGTASYANSAGNSTQWNGRTLDIGTEAGSNASWLLIDDNGVVRHRPASYFATAGHTHNYLPLSGGTMTGNITYNKLGTSYIGNGTNDAANMVGGGFNNLVISSWNGISFTTSCSSAFLNKNAVSIDCRNGILAAASLRVGNGSGSTINFCTNGGTANPGAKIVAYNDRIEFVFA